MMTFKDMPLRRKLMASILLTSIVVMLLMRGTFFAYELLAMRSATLQQLTTLGAITAANSTSALAFANTTDAQEILATLKTEPYVSAAAIYDVKGKLFVRYPSSLAPAELPSLPGDSGYTFKQSYLDGFQPITERERHLGTLYLRFDTGELMREWLWGSLRVTLVVMAVVLLVAYLLSHKLRTQISRPILALAETARTISERNDFSIRAEKHGHDEIGRLTDSFNEMLAGIEHRDNALHAANDALRAEHAERAHAQEQLVRAQKMEAIGQLTGGLAHDFNNILGAVIGNLDIAREVVVPESEAMHHCDAALDAALSAAELVKRLLAFSRRQPLHPQATDLVDVISNVRPILERTLGEQIRITIVSDTKGWLAIADADQIESAILNLAINARDAMPGGGALRIEQRAIEVDDTYASAAEDLKVGDYILLSISDTGTGMPADVVARAFDPFFTTKAPGAGSGLGLSMVIGTMKQLGGTAKIYSEVGVGTMIQLYLLRAKHLQPGSLAAASENENVVGGSERILLVEDNAQIREVSGRTLRGLGYEVFVAENADEALHMADGGLEFDLLFSDVVMAGRLNGISLARELRKSKPGIKVLLASGFSSPISAGTELADVGADFIAKPYRKAELARIVRSILDRPGGREFLKCV